MAYQKKTAVTIAAFSDFGNLEILVGFTSK